MRVELKKPNSDTLVSVHADKVDEYLGRGYSIPASSVTEVDDSVTISDIVDAIAILAVSDFSKKTGKPSVRSIERELGVDITAAQRNEAWEIVKG